MWDFEKQQLFMVLLQYLRFWAPGYYSDESNFMEASFYRSFSNTEPVCTKAVKEVSKR